MLQQSRGGKFIFIYSFPPIKQGKKIAIQI